MVGSSFGYSMLMRKSYFFHPEYPCNHCKDGQSRKRADVPKPLIFTVVGKHCFALGENVQKTYSYEQAAAVGVRNCKYPLLFPTIKRVAYLKTLTLSGISPEITETAKRAKE